MGPGVRPGNTSEITSKNRIKLRSVDRAGNEGRLLLDDGVIDGSAEAFVEDFDAEQFGRGGGAVFVGAGDGDVEGQDLVGVPGLGEFFETLDIGDGKIVLLVDGCDAW